MTQLQELLIDLIQSKRPFVAVDPGLGGTGWAFFPNHQEPPVKYGVLHEAKGLWQSRAKKVADDFGGLVSGFGNPVVLIEWPGFWGGSMKSFTSCERGDLFKLCYLIGSLSQNLQVVPRLISPMIWKGQLTKDAVRRRIIRLLGDDYVTISEHAVDAIGIGIALAGKL